MAESSFRYGAQVRYLRGEYLLAHTSDYQLQDYHHGSILSRLNRAGTN